MTSGTPKKINDKLIAWILALLTLAVLLSTAPHIGLTWDEPAYIAAAESYSAWMGQLVSQPTRALNHESINLYWRINHEHPPLDKVWSGLVWSVARLAFDDLTAHRLGNMLLVAALVAMLYLMIAETYGRMAGLLAVGALLTLPRFFFHAHLAALDVPAAMAIFAVIYVFWKTKDRPGWQSTVALGVAWGLAMATKVNAAFVMPTLLLWWLLFQRELRLFKRLVLASIVAFPVFVLMWPWLYPSPFNRMVKYVRFITVDHWEIGQWYLHAFHMPPPWHFPFVMMIAVVPLTLFLLFWVGILRTVKEKEHRALGVLFVLCALVPLLALSIGQSMVYDNDRLFMPAFPYIAALVGVGLAWVLDGTKVWLKQSGRASLATPAAVIVIVLVYAPHLILSAPLYPHWLSYYSETIGGLPGATRLGLETTYWCETYNEVLDYLDANAKDGDTVWVDPWSHDVMVYYQLYGRLRDDLQISSPKPVKSILDTNKSLQPIPYSRASFVVLHHLQRSYAKGGLAYPIQSWLEGREPDFRFSHQGIPLIDVYRRRP
jgi:4-amino-4-deoxy-L-arabinose transferase-like glycosyltransferase